MVPPLAFKHRIVITFLVALAILLALALYGYLTGGWDVEAAPGEQPSSKWDEHLNELEQQALDEAFKKQIASLYTVWVTDNYQPKIPPRALNGARNARDAYIRSMEAIDQRKQVPR